MSEILPFLSTLAPSSGVRSFTSALPVAQVPSSGNSPWAPQPVAPAAPAAPATPAIDIDVEAIRADAIVQGRAQGMRETENLRAKLQQTLDALAAAQAASATTQANLIADAASTVVDAWLGTPGSAEKFMPIVRAWQARSTQPATVQVNPLEAEALEAAIGESTLSVVADAAIPPGTLQIRGPSHELTHNWESRLAELREAIVAALEVKS